MMTCGTDTNSSSKQMVDMSSGAMSGMMGDSGADTEMEWNLRASHSAGITWSHSAESRVLQHDQGPKAYEGANLGKLDEGEALLRDVLRLMIQQWGENGRSSSKVRIHLADVLFDKGEVKEAIGLYEQGLKVFDSLLGGKHPDTRECAIKLAGCHVNSDDVDSAKAVMDMYCLNAEDLKAPVRMRLERILLEKSKGSKEKVLLKIDEIGSDEEASFIVV